MFWKFSLKNSSSEIEVKLTLMDNIVVGFCICKCISNYLKYIVKLVKHAYPPVNV